MAVAEGLQLAVRLHVSSGVRSMSAEIIALFLPVSPWEAIIAAAMIICAVLVVLRVRQSRLFRGYRDLESDLKELASTLEGGKLDRDKDDFLITGQLKQVPFFIRFSHSETAPGLYVRCSAAVNFTLTFAASTPEDTNGMEVCRTGEAAFDHRFTARTDNRIRTKQLFSQTGCVEQLQQLCCSNKTMLRLAEDTIELSEALIPSDTACHIASHLASMVLLGDRLAAMTPGRNLGNALKRNTSWVVRAAAVAAITLLVAGYFIFEASPTTVTATVPEASAQDKASREGLAIPNSSGWTAAEVGDLNQDFVAWLQRSGATPETKIILNATAEGDGKGVVHVLRPTTGEKTRRIVWIFDKSVVCDLVEPVDGVARIPRKSLSAISWAEGSAPSFTPDGDGLLVVRDHTKPETATVYFTSEGVLHTAVPADFQAISLF